MTWHGLTLCSPVLSWQKSRGNMIPQPMMSPSKQRGPNGTPTPLPWNNFPSSGTHRGLARDVARDWMLLLQTFIQICSCTESLSSVDHLARFSPGHNLESQSTSIIQTAAANQKQTQRKTCVKFPARTTILPLMVLINWVCRPTASWNKYCECLVNVVACSPAW